MDWDQLEATTVLLVTTMTRFGGVVDAERLFDLANANDPDWRDDPVSLRLHYRALDIIDLLGLASKPDGINRQLTEAGRSLAASPDPSALLNIRDDVRLAEWAIVEESSSLHHLTTNSAQNTFARLELGGWRQFAAVEIDFHPRLTILTGANGAGKTTLLNVLAPHFSWNAQLLSSSTSGKAGVDLPYAHVGQLHYMNGARTPIEEPVAEGIRVSTLAMPTRQPVPGIFISSHRSISSYQPLQTLPPRFSTANVLLNQFAGEVQARYFGGSGQYPPLYRMKEALVSAAMHGYGNAAVVANDEAREIWESFQTVLRNLLPRGFSFRRLVVEDADIMLETAAARFPLEAVSGGLSAMLELGWQIFLRGRESTSFTVCIDEPENHLHPELQRTIMPALLNAFPNATFIVATHSPFVVTSARDSVVYALRADPDGVIRSRAVRNLNPSGTSDETLMSVLGLDTPLPLWAERQVSEAIADLPADPTVDQLRAFRERLVEAGLEEQFSAALSAIRSGEEHNDQAQ